MDLKTNEGLIFRNQSENEKAPQFSGRIDVEGEQYEIALWVREGAKGKFYSAKISEPYQPKAKAKGQSKSSGSLTPKPKPKREADEDEDIFN